MPDEDVVDPIIESPPIAPSDDAYSALEAKTREAYASSHGVEPIADPDKEANDYLERWVDREWPKTMRQWTTGKSPTLVKAAAVPWVSPYADKIRADLNERAKSGRGMSPAVWKKVQEKLQERVAKEAATMQRLMPEIAKETTSDPATRAYVAMLRQRNAMAGTAGVSMDGITGHLQAALRNAIGPWPVIPQVERSLSGAVEPAPPATISSAQAAGELEQSRAGDWETRVPQLTGIARGMGAQAAAMAAVPATLPFGAAGKAGTALRWLAPQAAMAAPPAVGIAQRQVEGAITGDSNTPSLGAEVTKAGGGLARGAGVMAGASVALNLLGFRGAAAHLILPLLAENITNPEVADTFARAGNGDADAQRAAVDHVVGMFAMGAGAHVAGGVAPRNEAANMRGRAVALDKHVQDSVEYIRDHGATGWLRARKEAGAPVTKGELLRMKQAMNEYRAAIEGQEMSRAVTEYEAGRAEAPPESYSEATKPPVPSFASAGVPTQERTIGGETTRWAPHPPDAIRTIGPEPVQTDPMAKEAQPPGRQWEYQRTTGKWMAGERPPPEPVTVKDGEGTGSGRPVDREGAAPAQPESPVAQRAEPVEAQVEPFTEAPLVQEPRQTAPVEAGEALPPPPAQPATPAPEPATAQGKAMPEAPPEIRTPPAQLPVAEGHLFGRTELYEVEPAFARIVREYGKRRGVPRDSWDDLHQDAWMAVRKDEGRYDPSKPPEAFVRTVVDRTALDMKAKLSTKTAKAQEPMTEEAAAGAVSREMSPQDMAVAGEIADRVMVGEPVGKVTQGVAPEVVRAAMARLGERLTPEKIVAIGKHIEAQRKSKGARDGTVLVYSGGPVTEMVIDGLKHAYRWAKETVFGTNKHLIDDLVQRVGRENDPGGLTPKLHQVERDTLNVMGELSEYLNPFLREVGGPFKDYAELTRPYQAPDGLKSGLLRALEDPAFRATLSPESRAVVEHLVRLQDKGTGALMQREKLRIQLADRETYADFTNRGGNVAVNMPTKEASEAIRVGSGPVFEAMVDAYAASPKNQAWVKKYGKTRSAVEFFHRHFTELHNEMTKPGREAGELAFNSEFARVFPFSPDFVDVGGQTIALHVVTPYEYGNTLCGKVAIRSAFNRVFGTGDRSTLRPELEAHASANRGNLTAFEATQALSGIGVDRPMTTPGTEWRWMADGYANLSTVRKALMLTGSYFVQLSESLGNIQSHLPLKDYFTVVLRNAGGRTIQRALGNQVAFDALTEGLMRSGAYSPEIANYSIDPTNPVRSYSRALSAFLARATGHHFANTAQERTAGAAQVLIEERFAQGKATAYDKTAEMRLGFSVKDVEHHAATAKARYDAARAAGKSHLEAIFSNPYSLRATLEAPRWLVGANRKAAGTSRIEQHPVFKEVWFFSRFPIHMARSLVRDGEVVVKAWQAKRKDLVMAQAWRIAKATGGKIAAGQIGYLLTSQIFNGSEDRRAKWNEMTRSPGAFLNSCLQAYMYQLGGGPLGSIMRVYAAGGNKSEAALRATIPGTTVAEIYELMAGEGAYRKDATWPEKAWRFSKRATPGLKAAETIAFTVGLGAPDKDRDAMVSAYWRYCRENGLYDAFQESQHKEFTNVCYRMHNEIRNGRAEAAKRMFDEYIAKNGLHRGNELQRVRASMQRRLLFGDQKKWTPERIAHFKSVYGDRVYQNLLKMDDLTRLAF